MIDPQNLLSFSNHFPDERTLEKDYIINLMLKTISINRISNMMEFKGGTALYIFHGLDRFSEDLDFSCIRDPKALLGSIDTSMDSIIRDFGMSYNIAKSKGNQLTKDKKGNVIGIRSELFIEGPLFARNRKRYKIKIDISLRKDVLMKPETARIISKYNDIGQMSLYKMPLKEALAEKIASIAERSKARDIYDAYFIMNRLNEPYDNSLVKAKFEERNEVFSNKKILERISAVSEAAWKEELSYIIRELPVLGEVKRFLSKTIDGGTGAKQHK